MNIRVVRKAFVIKIIVRRILLYCMACHVSLANISQDVIAGVVCTIAEVKVNALVVERFLSMID